MKKLPLFLIPLVLPAISWAQSGVPINVNIPGNYANNTPCGIVANFFSFSLLIGAILAFGAIVYGGLKYLVSPGNSSQQADGKSWIYGALQGMLILLLSYLIFYTLNPALTSLSCPGLNAIGGGGGGGGAGYSCQNGTSCVSVQSGAQYPDLPSCQAQCPAKYNCIPTANPVGVCNAAVGACSPSPALSTAVSCINGGSLHGRIGYTTNGHHKCTIPPNPLSISCHFGGPNCKDGGHAFDISSIPGGMTWAQALTVAQGCAATTCFCETSVEGQRPGCSAPGINHLHCNVANGPCGCN